MTRLKKIVYLVSDINKAISFEWVASSLRSKFNLTFILIGRPASELSKFLKLIHVECIEISDEETPQRWRQWIKIFIILRAKKPDTVHTHLWRANLLGLSTSWLLGVKQRVYTRHHATTHYHEFPSGRKWDVLCNWWATDIIAISKNVQEILIEWDKADERKIKLIHHGFEQAYFQSVSELRVTALRQKYGLSSSDFPVIGVISRYVEWKGIQYIIPAFERIRKKFHTAKLILANTHGDYAAVIKAQLASLPPNSFLEIEFEEDLAALYQLFTLFVHVPIDPFVEAFGQTYIEPLMAGVPAIFTMSGVAREFIEHKQNAWQVNFKNSNQIEEGVLQLLSDDNLRNTLIAAGKTAAKDFSLEHAMLALEKVYVEVL